MSRAKRKQAAVADSIAVEDVVINPDALLLDDMPAMARLSELGSAGWATPPNVEAALDILDRVVVGGVRGRGFKMGDFWLLINALIDAMNPEDAEGND